MYTVLPSKAMPRSPRSQPRPCQSMPIVFQSSTRIARSPAKSTRYPPPWLSPWRLPRTTDVATKIVRRRSESEPELQPVGPRPIDRQALHAPAVVEEDLRALIPDVVDERGRAPPV